MKTHLICLFLAILCLAIPGYSQTSVILAPAPIFQSTSQTGLPNSFGCVFTYISGTTTPLSTYTDSTGTTLNQNPVILSASGSAQIWIAAGSLYSFRVKSSGGTHCSSGTTLYTIQGIGGGLTQISSTVAFSGSPQFTLIAQNQLFSFTLTGNATSLSLLAPTIQPPGIVTWEIIQDGTGSHTFAWPPNVIGGSAICSTANCVTQQTFIWNGVTAIAVGPAVIGSGPAISTGNITAAGTITATGGISSGGAITSSGSISATTNISGASGSIGAGGLTVGGTIVGSSSLSAVSATIANDITSTTGKVTSNKGFFDNSRCSVNNGTPTVDCGSAWDGFVVVPTTTTAVVVDTTAITATSLVFLFPSINNASFTGSPTCTAPAAGTVAEGVRLAGIDFTFTLPSTSGQTCWMFLIINP